MIRVRQWIESALRAWTVLPTVLRALVPAAIMGLLWWSSAHEHSSEPTNQLRSLYHNGMHVVAYAALCGSLILVGEGRPSSADFRRRLAICCLLVTVAYGVVDEVHQSYVPGRVCSGADLWADASGAALAIALLGILLHRSRRCAAALPYCVASCILSVACATWGSW